MLTILAWLCVGFIRHLLAQKYNVSVIELTSHPIVSYIDGNSDFQQTFNPSFITASASVSTPGLIMRSQNCTAAPNGSCVFCAGTGSAASKLTFVECNNITTGECMANSVHRVSNDSIVFSPSSQMDIRGTEDPRVVYNKLDAHYYMFYTSWGYANASNPKQETVYLSLAKSQTPNRADSWTKYGPIFPPNSDGSKSGALLIEYDQQLPDFGRNYLFWGAGHIELISTDNITQYDYNSSVLYLEKRTNGFDSGLVESGPPPLQLNITDVNGQQNYLFFYNSMTEGFPDANGSAYHPGFVIIDKHNKSHIVQRSGLNEPLLAPTFAWDIGISPYTCNVPRVVFLEAAEMFSEAQKWQYAEYRKQRDGLSLDLSDSDLIRVYFGGADAVIGTAVVQVTYE